MAETCLLAMWCPVHRWRDSIPGSLFPVDQTDQDAVGLSPSLHGRYSASSLLGTELENLPAVLREKAQAEAPRGRKY
jgi:hypothetical protein